MLCYLIYANFLSLQLSFSAVNALVSIFRSLLISPSSSYYLRLCYLLAARCQACNRRACLLILRSVDLLLANWFDYSTSPRQLQIIF